MADLTKAMGINPPSLYATFGNKEALFEKVLDRYIEGPGGYVKQAMLAHDEVMECHMVAGGFDYLLKVRVTDMESYRRFLGDAISAVRGVQQTHTYFVMEEVKSTHRIIVPEH